MQENWHFRTEPNPGSHRTRTLLSDTWQEPEPNETLVVLEPEQNRIRAIRFISHLYLRVKNKRVVGPIRLSMITTVDNILAPNVTVQTQCLWQKIINLIILAEISLLVLSHLLQKGNVHYTRLVFQTALTHWIFLAKIFFLLFVRNFFKKRMYT